MFEEGYFDDVLPLGHTDQVTEAADGLGGVAAASEAGEGGHAGVVPAADVALVDQLGELALAHHSVAQVEPGELYLLGMVDVQGVEEPVVEGAVVFVLHGADGVGDAFNGVGLAVGEVVHGVDDPLVAGAVMGSFEDAVEDGVPHVDVARRHVDPGPEDSLALLAQAVLHLVEEGEVFFYGAVAVGALDAGLCEGAAVLADLVGVEVVDVGHALPDEVDGEFVELVEVVGGEVEVVAPVPAEPSDVLEDAVDELLFLPGGVGVVEAHVAAAAVLVGEAEVEAHGLGVADVEVAVGLRGEAGDDLAAEAAGGVVGLHGGADEVEGGFGVESWR